MPLVMPFLVSMVVTIAWLPVLGRVATRWNIVDRPGARKVHAVPIPRIGGIAMLIGVLVSAIVVIPLDARGQSLLVAVAVIALFGALDDRFDLDYRIKLVGQLAAALIVVVGGGIQIHTITLDERMALPEIASVPLTLLFLIGITNAINLADGLDGLAGGTTFLCLGALALLAYSGGQSLCAMLALAFAGSVLGFLRFNTYPASVFMGDAGSQVLGFAVGVLSMLATQSGESAVSAATPILLLALPILDTLSVMVERISEGRSPFSADRNHIHHKLLNLGFDHHEAVMVIYLIQADLFLAAFWLRFESDLTILGAVTLFFGAAIWVLQSASRRGWRFRSAHASTRDTPLSRLITHLRQPHNLPHWSYVAVAVAVTTYGILIIAETASLSRDVHILVIGLFAVTFVLLLLFRGRPLSLIEKAALYVTVAVLVYLDSMILPETRAFTALNWSVVMVAAVGTVLRLRLASDRRFVMTPLDLIVLFVALVVPSLSASVEIPGGGAEGIAKLVILFYAVEVLLSRVELGVVWMRMTAAILLMGLLFRPLLSP